MTPDEKAYTRYGNTLREHGIRRGFRLLAERFLRDDESAAYPAPIRWLYALVCAAVGSRALPLASLLAAPLVAAWALGRWDSALLVASSPLLWILGRGRLQDAPVAVLTLAAIGFAIRHDPVGLPALLAVLLAAKEVSPLSWPALAVAWCGFGGEALPLLASFALAGSSWAVATLAIYGRNALPMLRRALSGHDTEYTRQHQSGGTHRLVVDLALLSPLVIAFSLSDTTQTLGWVAITLIAAHALSPVNNVRNVLAADLLLRAAVAAIVPLPVLPLLVVADVIIAWRCRKIQDPVTAGLMSDLFQSRQPSRLPRLTRR